MAADNTAPAPTEAETRGAALTKAYGRATTRLREKHKPEFEQFYVEEAKRLGQVYVPPKTAEQKAREAMEAIAAEYPEVASQVVLGTQTAPPSGV